MNAQESAWQEGVDAAEALAPETGLIAQLDPADFGGSLLSVIARAARRPAEVAAAGPAVWHYPGQDLAGRDLPVARVGSGAAGTV
jgi:hypothetical protein